MCLYNKQLDLIVKFVEVKTTQVLVFCTNVLTHYYVILIILYLLSYYVDIVNQLLRLNVNRIVLTARSSRNSHRIEWCLVEGFLSNNSYL